MSSILLEVVEPHNLSLFGELIDDLWIRSFYFLSCKDFLSIRETCSDFHSLTKPDLPIINKYWESQCKILVSNIADNYSTNEWHQFYLQLCYFLQKWNYVRKVGTTTKQVLETGNPTKQLHIQLKPLLQHWVGFGNILLSPLTQATWYYHECDKIVDMILCNQDYTRAQHLSPQQQASQSEFLLSQLLQMLDDTRTAQNHESLTLITNEIMSYDHYKSTNIASSIDTAYPHKYICHQHLVRLDPSEQLSFDLPQNNNELLASILFPPTPSSSSSSLHKFSCESFRFLQPTLSRGPMALGPIAAADAELEVMDSDELEAVSRHCFVDKLVRFEYTWVTSDAIESPSIHRITIPHKATVLALKHLLAKTWDVPVGSLYVCDIWRSRIHRHYRDQDLIQEMNPVQDDIFVYKCESNSSLPSVPIVPIIQTAAATSATVGAVAAVNAPNAPNALNGANGNNGNNAGNVAMKPVMLNLVYQDERQSYSYHGSHVSLGYPLVLQMDANAPVTFGDLYHRVLGMIRPLVHRESLTDSTVTVCLSAGLSTFELKQGDDTKFDMNDYRNCKIEAVLQDKEHYVGNVDNSRHHRTVADTKHLMQFAFTWIDCQSEQSVTKRREIRVLESARIGQIKRVLAELTGNVDVKDLFVYKNRTGRYPKEFDDLDLFYPDYQDGELEDEVLVFHCKASGTEVVEDKHPFLILPADLENMGRGSIGSLPRVIRLKTGVEVSNACIYKKVLEIVKPLVGKEDAQLIEISVQFGANQVYPIFSQSDGHTVLDKEKCLFRVGVRRPVVALEARSS